MLHKVYVYYSCETPCWGESQLTHLLFKFPGTVTAIFCFLSLNSSFLPILWRLGLFQCCLVKIHLLDPSHFFNHGKTVCHIKMTIFFYH